MKKIILVFVLFCCLTGNCSFGQAADNQPAADPTLKKEPASDTRTTNEAKELDYKLGDFLVSSADEAPQYIKMEVIVKYDGDSDEPLKQCQDIVKEAINILLMKKTAESAKADNKAHLLHKEIQNVIEEKLAENYPGSIKIISIAIPVFLISQ